jgi:hypothetical protein
VPTAPQPPQPAERPERPEPSGEDEAPVLPQLSTDENDTGWGDRDEQTDRDTLRKENAPRFRGPPTLDRSARLLCAQ